LGKDSVLKESFFILDLELAVRWSPHRITISVVMGSVTSQVAL